MKKSLFLAAFSLLAAGAFAQSNTIWEAQVGLNMANISESPAGSHIGYNLGLRRTHFFSSSTTGTYYNAAALLSNKGAGTGEEGFSLSYLEVPVHYGYKFAVNEKIGAFVEAGPYVAYGLFAANNAFDFMKRLDAGVGGRVGVNLNKCSLSLGYDMGLLPLAEGGGSNRNLTISVGYKF